MTAIDLTNSNTATVDGRTYTYNSTTSRWEITTGNSPGLTTEQVQDAIAAQLVTNGSHTGISFAYDDSGDGAIDATIGTLNQNTTGTAATLTTPRSIGGPSFDGSADINLPGVNTTGNQNTSGTAATLATPREINGVAFDGSADITIPGGDPIIYATMALLVAATGMSAGAMAFVTANNNLYLYTGSGWFKIATVENNSPSAITGVAAATTLASDGTATVITAVSTDPEGFPLTWSYAVTTGSLTNGGGASATVSQADNVFTITPTTTAAYAGTFSITFSATDGTNAVTAASAFTLTFETDWSTATQQQELIASDAAAGDNFGSSAAIDGDTAVFGAFLEGTGGSAYVFTRSGTTWTQQAKLTGSTVVSGDEFGYSVAISGDTIVVGARAESSTDDAYNGDAYVFTRSGTTWSQQAKFSDTLSSGNSHFGYSVDIDGNTIVVGAPMDSPGTSDHRGRCHIYTRSGTSWSLQQSLASSTGDDYAYFGADVAIDGDTVVVGSSVEDSSGNNNCGAAYIFTRSGTSWSQQERFAPTTATNAYFGNAVDISGDTAIIGAYGESNTGRGVVRIYTRSGTSWSLEQTLLSRTGTNEMFGMPVDIEDDVCVIGQQTNYGGAYVYSRTGTTWTYEKTIIPTSASNTVGWIYHAQLGLSDDTIVSGVLGTDSEGSNTGAGYVWTA
jgi:hypothetical protein